MGWLLLSFSFSILFVVFPFSSCTTDISHQADNIHSSKIRQEHHHENGTITEDLEFKFGQNYDLHKTVANFVDSNGRNVTEVVVSTFGEFSGSFDHIHAKTIDKIHKDEDFQNRVHESALFQVCYEFLSNITNGEQHNETRRVFTTAWEMTRENSSVGNNTEVGIDESDRNLSRFFYFLLQIDENIPVEANDTVVHRITSNFIDKDGRNVTKMMVVITTAIEPEEINGNPLLASDMEFAKQLENITRDVSSRAYEVCYEFLNDMNLGNGEVQNVTRLTVNTLVEHTEGVDNSEKPLEDRNVPVEVGNQVEEPILHQIKHPETAQVTTGLRGNLAGENHRRQWSKNSQNPLASRKIQHHGFHQRHPIHPGLRGHYRLLGHHGPQYRHGQNVPHGHHGPQYSHGQNVPHGHHGPNGPQYRHGQHVPHGHLGHHQGNGSKHGQFEIPPKEVAENQSNIDQNMSMPPILPQNRTQGQFESRQGLWDGDLGYQPVIHQGPEWPMASPTEMQEAHDQRLLKALGAGELDVKMTKLDEALGTGEVEPDRRILKALGAGEVYGKTGELDRTHSGMFDEADSTEDIIYITDDEINDIDEFSIDYRNLPVPNFKTNELKLDIGKERQTTNLNGKTFPIDRSG